jgi:hypothetical protein
MKAIIESWYKGPKKQRIGPGEQMLRFKSFIQLRVAPDPESNPASPAGARSKH